MHTNVDVQNFTMLGVGLVAIAMRIASRLSMYGKKGLWVDDYLMMMAALSYTVQMVLAYSFVKFMHGIANSDMTDEQRASLDPNSDEYRYRVRGSQNQVVGWSMYVFYLWTLKCSVCAFYMRLTDGLGNRRRVMMGFILLPATWLIVFLSILLGCHPISKNWQIYPDPGKYCHPGVSHINVFVTVVFDVLTDLYLILIPIPMLLETNMKPIKKYGLVLLFSGGIFVMLAAVVRCIFIVSNRGNGAQQAGLWGTRETFVAVITSNAPMIYSLLRFWWGRYKGTLSSALRSGSAGMVGGSGANSQGSKRSNVVLYEDRDPRRGQGPRSVNHIPTMNDSEENMIIEEMEEQRHARRMLSQNPIGLEQAAGDIEQQELQIVPPQNRPRKPVSLSTRHSNGGITKQVLLEITEERQGQAALQRTVTDEEIEKAVQGAAQSSFCYVNDRGNVRSTSSAERAMHGSQNFI